LLGEYSLVGHSPDCDLRCGLRPNGETDWILKSQDEGATAWLLARTEK